MSFFPHRKQDPAATLFSAAHLLAKCPNRRHWKHLIGTILSCTRQWFQPILTRSTSKSRSASTSGRCKVAIPAIPPCGFYRSLFCMCSPVPFGTITASIAARISFSVTVRSRSLIIRHSSIFRWMSSSVPSRRAIASCLLPRHSASRTSARMPPRLRIPLLGCSGCDGRYIVR
jgi:hypothetical protein